LIIQHRKKAFILSGILIAAAIASLVFNMAVNGINTVGMNLGIDFAGGTVIQLNLGEDYKTEEIREVLAGFGLENASVQKVKVRETNGNLSDEGVLIKTAILEDSKRDDLIDAFRDRWPHLDPEDKRIESVGGMVGGEQKKWSVLALAAALVAMIIYITIRFEFKFALATIAALIHDVIIVLGVFSLLRMEINLPFVAALLTIIGYSINDSIVIIDRIRENIKHKRKQDYAEVVDNSIRQSLTRSLNTSLTTLMVLIALIVGFYIFVGNMDLVYFVIAMMIGVVAGTYSSVFIASPLWLTMKEREFRRKAKTA
jgi:preprotein translocase SecF subunit